MKPIQLKLKDTFNKELPADPNRNNTRRQVFEACYSYAIPRIPSNPKMLHVSKETAALLGLNETDTTSPYFLEVFSGQTVLDNSDPYAMCYGGHQFGHWAGQLGDGRAINLAEVEHQNQSWTLQLKGSGETPYSRTADGLAVLRSSIREHLCSEAMFHLGVPTTRSLSLALTGDEVMRDMLYDGNAAYEKGAVICRVAPSFIRFGNFQIFASREDTATLRKLTDYTIKHFFPEIDNSTNKNDNQNSKEVYVQFFQEVADRTLDMVVHWQRVGFVHGVMNTDNMSILGLTIDYGPYGWLEGYDHSWTPNTTDRAQSRYRYGHQPNIALWNLYQLANALYPLIEDVVPLQKILDDFAVQFADQKMNMMRSKLGLEQNLDTDKQLDEQLVEKLEEILHLTETDMTIFYRNLSNVSKEEDSTKAIEKIKDAFYKPEELTEKVLNEWSNWFKQYIGRLQKENISDTDRKQKMNLANPKYVLRNYMAQLAIDAADKGDYSVISELYELLKKPYDEQPEHKKWFVKRPEWARHKVGCSMLSCSS